MGVEYVIRDVVFLVREFEKKGIEVIRFNIGDFGKYDFQLLEYMKEVYCRVIKEGYNYYGLSEGFFEMREVVVQCEKRKNGVDIIFDDVCVIIVVIEVFQFFFGVFFDFGDNIFVLSLSYLFYIGFVKFYGGIFNEYDIIEENGWQLDIDDMRKCINERIKVIVVINFNNFIGVLYEKKIVKEIFDLVGEYDIFVISDEIYDFMIYEGEYVLFGLFIKDVFVIVMNGFFKVYFVIGWCLGYFYYVDFENKFVEVREVVDKFMCIRICLSILVQFVVIVGLIGLMDYLEEYMKKFKERRDYIYKCLMEILGVSIQKLQGVFYIFLCIDECFKWKSDKEFVFDVFYEVYVFFVYGLGFGRVGNWYFCIVFFLLVEILEKVMDRFEEFMRKRLVE